MSSKLKKAFAIAGILLFGFFHISEFTPDDKNIIHVENYKVRSGDTFWTITEHYRNLDARDLYIMEYQDEVRALNPHLRDNHFQLEPNDLIIVKYIQRR